MVFHQNSDYTFSIACCLSYFICIHNEIAIKFLSVGSMQPVLMSVTSAWWRATETAQAKSAATFMTRMTIVWLSVATTINPIQTTPVCAVEQLVLRENASVVRRNMCIREGIEGGRNENWQLHAWLHGNLMSPSTCELANGFSPKLRLYLQHSMLLELLY